MSAHLLAFVVVAIPVLLPGPDVLLVLRNTAVTGRRVGGATAAGICTGVVVHASAATVGLSALLATSAQAFTIVKLVGAAYLGWLGLQALRAAYRGAERGPAIERSRHRLEFGQAYRRGLLANVLNPKVAVFFLAFLPQFLDPTAAPCPQTMLLSATFIVMSVVWLAGVVLAASAGRSLLARAHVQRRLDALAGVVFLGFAGRLATAGS